MGLAVRTFALDMKIRTIDLMVKSEKGDAVVKVELVLAGDTVTSRLYNGLSGGLHVGNSLYLIRLRQCLLYHTGRKGRCTKKIRMSLRLAIFM